MADEFSVQNAGQLVEFVKECVLEHGATQMTDVFVRDGEDGPMKRIACVKMMQDNRGRAIILQTSAILVN